MQQWQIGKEIPSITELEDILKVYPWFSIARQYLYRQLASEMSEYSPNLIKQAAPYLYSTEELVKQVRRDSRLKPEPKEEKETRPVVIDTREKEIFVVGGDYFAKEDYQQIKDEGGSVLDSFKADIHREAEVECAKSNDQFSDDEYCTETLAKIYLQQGCFKRALEVYDKLILLYPEKSAYFATLKEEIKKFL